MKLYSVYILECENDKLYTGITTDVERRFREHLSGRGAKFTRMHRPIQIVYCQEFEDRSSALKAEAEIKKLNKAAKLKLIQEHAVDGP
ncbi:MAG: GIY-YIG nuclease family protein [Candidatus Wallacebacter cryptica]|jgi:putative endonuclease|nr:GIY-YIG nuclease family protein [Bacillota bacterium]